jgi:hypothetical protein
MPKLPMSEDIFTGKQIPAFALPEPSDPLMCALELSEVARILGGDLPARAAHTEHRIFLL